jgi:uncharacterized protein (DUF1778 family)
MPVALRTERTEARLLPEQKSRIEQAAALRGLSVSDFIMQHADEAAIQTIRQHTSWMLRNKEAELFVSVLLDPPRPGSRLNASAKR